MTMEEEVDSHSREKRSMMNYTKKSRPIGNNPPNIQPGAAKNLSVAKEKGIWQGKWTYT
jgi:hypothetical protein